MYKKQLHHWWRRQLHLNFVSHDERSRPLMFSTQTETKLHLNLKRQDKTYKLNNETKSTEVKSGKDGHGKHAINFIR